MSRTPRSLRVLYAWEWGAGSGHVQRVSPIAEAMISSGHELTMVVKDTTRVPTSIAQSRICVVSCPPLKRCPRDEAIPPRNLAAIAWNLGYHDSENLSSAVRAWRAIIERVRPDFILQDFGLTAGLVARSYGIRTVRIGTGYTCPPRNAVPIDIPAFKHLATHAEGDSNDAVAVNSASALKRIMNHIAIACRANGVSVPSRWDEVVNGCDDDILATLPLLDPYASVRPHARWDGIWSSFRDRLENSGEHAFADLDANVLAYLKPFANWKRFFNTLKSLRVRVDLVPDGVDEGLLSSCDPRWVRVCKGFRSIPEAAGRGMLLINNGNHGSTALSLLHGMPVVACPLYFEQRLTAAAIARVGGGVFIDIHSPIDWTEKLSQALESQDLRNRAQRFANRYGTVTQASLKSVVQRMPC